MKGFIRNTDTEKKESSVASLNKQSGNMYEWIQKTFNPISGKCPYECGYCYMTKMAGRFKSLAEPLHIKDRFGKLGKGNFIFVGSSTDMFSDPVPDEWITRVINHCRKYPENKYIFQSKNPKRFHEFENLFTENMWLCATIESNRDYKDTKAPKMQERAEAMQQLNHKSKMVTVEPIMNFDTEDFISLLKITGASWINIGSVTKGTKLDEPDKEKTLSLIKEIQKFSETTFKKENLKRLVGNQ